MLGANDDRKDAHDQHQQRPGLIVQTRKGMGARAGDLTCIRFRPPTSSDRQTLVHIGRILNSCVSNAHVCAAL